MNKFNFIHIGIGFLIGFIFSLIIHMACAFVCWDYEIFSHYGNWRLDACFGFIGGIIGFVGERF